MSMLVALTAGIGFTSSVLMLHGGLDNMGLRYAAACALAYLSFLIMLWIWLRLVRWETRGVSSPADLGADIVFNLSAGAGGTSHQPGTLEFKGGGGGFDGGGASANVEFADAGGVISSAPSGGGSGADGLSFDLGEVGGVAVLLMFLAAVPVACGALFYAAFNLVGTAPLLLAELLFDSVLAAGLYRRFRYQPSRHWLETALERTFRPFLAVLTCVGMAGFAFSWAWPQASSLGEVIRILFFS